MVGNKTLYDLDELRAIPILDVCDYLGLPVEKRGKNFWCKVRPETRASVILHPDTNYFYDFGNAEHGNNIALVQYARGGASVGTAIRELAEAFHIKPSESREDSFLKPLNNWEYRKIGLYGDLATKNLVFPVATATTEELLEMEYACRMPMNQLRTTDPDMYRHILMSKAIPYVENKRDCFYMSVWNHYNFLQLMDRHVLFFDSERTALKFDAEVKDLEQSERALYKACLGTDLRCPEPRHYDPQRILSRLLRGELTFSLGPLMEPAVNDFAAQNQCGTCKKEVSYDAYCAAELDDCIHCAEFRSGRVLITFSDSDKGLIEKAFPPIRKGKSPLLTVLLDAQARSDAAGHFKTRKQTEPVR